MNKFMKEHGQVILWFIFLVFMIISLSMVFTHGIRYAIVVFVLSFILLCPPIVKLIQRKTRLKKVVLGVVSAFVMMLTMLMTNHFSEARKEGQRNEKNFAFAIISGDAISSTTCICRSDRSRITDWNGGADRSASKHQYGF